jgi:hypothetical protein
LGSAGVTACFTEAQPSRRLSGGGRSSISSCDSDGPLQPTTTLGAGIIGQEQMVKAEKEKNRLKYSPMSLVHRVFYTGDDSGMHGITL